MSDKCFSAIDYGGRPLFLFKNARHNGSSIDLLVSDEILSKHEAHYEIECGRRGSPLPPVQTVADDVLNSVMSYAWPNGIPQEVIRLFAKRTVAISAHGNSYPGIGWAIHVANDVLIPVSGLMGLLLSGGYESLIFAVCNPERQRLKPLSGDVFYPLGDFGPELGKFEMSHEYGGARTKAVLL